MTGRQSEGRNGAEARDRRMMSQTLSTQWHPTALMVWALEQWLAKGEVQDQAPAPVVGRQLAVVRRSALLVVSDPVLQL